MSGVDLIAAERERQKTGEGWTAEHDDQHYGCELALAAVCYAAWAAKESIYILRSSDFRAMHRRDFMDPWPFDPQSDKRHGATPSPDERKLALIKAGALLAAEIDRLQRAEEIK